MINLYYQHVLKEKTFHEISARKTPFRVSFFTNANEVDGAIAGTDNAADKAMDNELSLEPRGNLGFSLAFFQEAC